MPRFRTLPDWILYTSLAVGVGLVWWVAVVILPDEGWGRPGRVTAFGLVALVVFLVVALVVHRNDWRKMEQDRIRRKRRMRS